MVQGNLRDAISQGCHQKVQCVPLILPPNWKTWNNWAGKLTVNLSEVQVMDTFFSI